MEDYMKNPRCIIPVPYDEPTTAAKFKRGLEYPLNVTYTLLLALLTAKPRESEMYKAEKKIWNEAMGTQFGNLHFPAAYDYFKGLDSWTTNGPLELAYRVLCNMWSWNARAAKTPNNETLVCYDVCTETCSDDDGIPEGDTDFPVARRALDVLPILSHQHHLARRHHTHHAHHEHSTRSDISETHQLTKRRPPYQYTVTGADGHKRSFLITLNDHDTVKEMMKADPNAAIGNELIGYNSVDDCGNPIIAQLNYNAQSLRRFETEHVMDGQLIASFLADASNGVLRSGATATNAGVSMSYFYTLKQRQ